MSKGKLQKFAEMETFSNVFQYPYSVIDQVPFEMKGHWREQYFHNDNPIVLELGCGKGEYTVGLAEIYPDMNFIGVDIKGARMHKGAKEALDKGLANVAFLLTLSADSRHFATDDDKFFLPNFQTYYESQWIERGLNIKYMRFILPANGELAEPDIEIELDDYRSYKRVSRSSVAKRK